MMLRKLYLLGGGCWEHCLEIGDQGIRFVFKELLIVQSPQVCPQFLSSPLIYPF